MEGFYIVRTYIKKGHPLYAQFINSFNRIIPNISGVSLNNINKNELKERISLFYASHIKEIESHCAQTLEQWNLNRDSFLQECENLFLNKRFINSAVWTIYPTVWQVYIQNIKRKAVSFPLRADTHDQHEALYVLLHELLHVYFYQYMETFMPIKKGKNIFDIAEIFNSVVMQQPRFKKFYPFFNITTYPIYANTIRAITSKITNSDSADHIIQYISEIIQEELH